MRRDSNFTVYLLACAALVVLGVIVRFPIATAGGLEGILSALVMNAPSNICYVAALAFLCAAIRELFRKNHPP